jgi:hypothetical protein
MSADHTFSYFDFGLRHIFRFRGSDDETRPAKLSGGGLTLENNNTSGGSADLLGIGSLGGGDTSAASFNGNGNGFSSETPTNNLTKYFFRKIINCFSE